MKKLKKILASLLIVVMVFTAAPLSSFVDLELLNFDFGIIASAKTIAPSGSCGDNVSYTYNSSTGELVISGEGPMTDYSYDGSPFYYSNVKSVVVCDSVTTIGAYAFRFCYSLKSVTIPDSVTTIGDSAFSYCYSLTGVTVPDSVTTIGGDAFRSCHSLTNIVVDTNNPSYSNDSRGALFDKNKTILIQYPFGNTNLSYTIPDSVIAINDSAFYDCNNLTSVTIPDSVTTIGDSAFCTCDSLISVTIGDNVTTIGDSAFRLCNNLTSVTIGESVTTIGDNAFWGCNNLTSVTIGKSVTTIGDNAFCSCNSLTKIVVDTNNPYYSNDNRGALFDKTKTILIQYPIGNTKSSYTIPDSVTAIGNNAFDSSKSLTSVTIGDSVTTIGNDAFSDCDSLTSVTIGDGVTTIGAYAFYDCNNLTSVTLGDSVTTIGDYTFYHCDSLSDVYYLGTQEQLKNIEIGTYNDYLLNATINYHTHAYISQNTTPATHTSEGVRTFTCECGDTYDEPIAKTKEHSYVSTWVASTCTEQGYTLNECECGDSYKTNYLSKTDHNDSNSDGICNDCGYDLTENCLCNCHKGGFMGFIWKIINFFQKLFKTNPTCECGVRHY